MCVLYADDTTLLCSSPDPVTLQQELDKKISNINKWFLDKKLSLNAKKLFGTNDVLSKFDGISLSPSFKYLGVTLDPNLTSYDHVTCVSSNVSERIGIICRVKYYLRSKALHMLDNALAMPHFDYCNTVWSNCSKIVNSQIVSSYFSHNPWQILAYTIRYRQLQYTKVLRTLRRLNHFNWNLKFTSLECKWNGKLNFEKYDRPSLSG